MAGNSVPVFFGAKARSTRPVSIEVTIITDLSDSMELYASFFSSGATIIALDNALRAQGIGLIRSNRYSFVSGGDSVNNTLSEIERYSTRFSGDPQRWISAGGIVSGLAAPPTLVADNGANTEDMGLAFNLVTSINRQYIFDDNGRIAIAASDAQSVATAFTVGPTYPHRYVGVHSVTLSISEPAGPNPVPAGVLIGFVYTTATTGAAIYNDNGSLNYRLEVPVANMTATATGGTEQINVDHARTTNGAIYRIDIDFNLLGESLGNVLGQYLFDIS